MIRAAQVVMFMCVMMLCSAAAVAADIYKWVDAKGVVHYSDRPHNQTAQKVTLKKGNVSDPVSITVFDEASESAGDSTDEGSNLAQEVSKAPQFDPKKQCAAIKAEVNKVSQSADAKLLELLRNKIKELGC
ncbi:DUF4124 domain-containing protein [Pseudoalteromonas tunicata]|jgi:hypothetical protein|uniref:DUF4124 domain-containing protein n=1 Tax=Pseudoalteromonas tunicata D2 TaxID=87626 RepID=A4CE95_9GAMM|nr:DUF4124 domain-containing protein [Pseudoalteromonas tunicata]ATC93056.1 hypothetical protein PTUN_a0235 [Pseudoalteromonas tunicata]EAR26907.1 hypothetical protein PTD2_10013 [Pseudoalteromonas tunicata D2]MDP4984641.1 DUF4124 domain-containing protein [Pseudoalteromonas tunicata]MDP5213625.1 DUF4124 domain-containing protein [Pseudoalteromonas tunicata]